MEKVIYRNKRITNTIINTTNSITDLERDLNRFELTTSTRFVILNEIEKLQRKVERNSQRQK